MNIAKYPRLIKALCRQFILCEPEAQACIEDYKAGFQYSVEAISWCGRTTKQALEIAIANRHY